MGIPIQEGTTGTLPVGPFVNGSGIPAGSLNVIMADIFISKAGGALATISGCATAYAARNGWYYMPYNATDTGTRGGALVEIFKSGYLPVWSHLEIIPTLKFGFLYGNGGVPTVVHTQTVGSVGHVASMANPIVGGGSIGHVASMANPAVPYVGSVGMVGSVIHVATMSNPIVGGGVIGSVNRVQFVEGGVIGSVNRVQFVEGGIIGSTGHVASGYTQTVGTVTRVLSVGSIDTTAITGGVIGTVAFVSGGIIGSVGHVASGYTQTVGTVTRVLSVGSIDTTAISGGVLDSVGSVGFVSGGIIGSVGHIASMANPTVPFVGSVGLVGSVLHVASMNNPIVGGGSIGHVASMSNPAVPYVGSVGMVGSVLHVGIVGTVNALGSQAKADVDAAVDVGLATTTYAEPASVPSATASLKDKLGWLAMKARNKVEQTATLQTVYDDAGTAPIGTASVADDGTTATRGEFS